MLGTIFLRTILIYFVVFLVMRLMGKREIGKLSIFDLVISIMIAEMAVIIVEDPSKHVFEGILPILTLMLIQIAFAWITLKSQKVREWMDGVPSILIDKGKINEREMRKQKYNLDDLILQLRTKNVTDIRDVEFAILETNGTLNVVEKQDTKKKKQQIRYEGLPLALIKDGKIQEKELEKIGKTRFWLKKELQDRGVKDMKDILYCSINHDQEFYIVHKD